MPRSRSRSSRRFVAATCFAAASTFLLPARQAQGAEASDLEPFIAHLEFQGYSCKVEDGQILARHATHNNLIVKPMAGGFLVRAGFVGKTPSELPRDAYVITNELNEAAAAARFYWGPEGRLFVESWFAGTYDKQRFAAFLEVWNRDLGLLGKVRERLAAFVG